MSAPRGRAGKTARMSARERKHLKSLARAVANDPVGAGQKGERFVILGAMAARGWMACPLAVIGAIGSCVAAATTGACISLSGAGDLHVPPEGGVFAPIGSGGLPGASAGVSCNQAACDGHCCVIQSSSGTPS